MRFVYFISFLFLLTAFNANAEDLLIVREDEIAEAIKEEFVEQGMEETADLEFFGGQTFFQIEDARTAKILVSDLKTDELQNKFSCKVEIFADGKAYAKTEVQGKYYVLGEVYVPARNINKGEVITEDMLKTIRVRMNRIKPANVIDKDKLINKETKKSLKEGKVVNARDIGNKILIRRNDIVTIVYKTDKMQITAKVQAMSDGAKGEKIEVMNTKSKKVLFAEVIDANTVEIEQ
ncbi:MAG: flagellar basal body P-ring formation protein FlgA [Alphaproteobacteria bacterium]|nr:flagellar basal body P-ring formation protein FlgA [Alphaproteobacteria bacterium]